jgi:hypothetical protein
MLCFGYFKEGGRVHGGSSFFSWAASLIGLFVFFGNSRGDAQSTSEYASLTGAITAASESQAGKKDKKPGLTGAMTSVQEAGFDAMGRAGGLLGQVGAQMAPPEIGTAAPEARSSSTSSEIPAQGRESAPVSEGSPLAPGTVRIHLNDGRKIDGVLVERSPEYVRLLIGGVEVTFFADEISRVDA